MESKLLKNKEGHSEDRVSYVKQFPKPGEMVFFDRSWYNRAVVEPVNDFCSVEGGFIDGGGSSSDLGSMTTDWPASCTVVGVTSCKKKLKIFG